MKKVFGLTLMVAVVISLIGCGQSKAAKTTEATTTEVVTEATTKEVTTTEAPTTEATVPEASANDAERLSSSSEITENVVITENVNQKKVSSEIFEETKNEKQKTIILGYYEGGAFAIYIADDDSDEVDVYLNEVPESKFVNFMFNYNFSEISLEDLNEYEGAGSGFGRFVDGVLEFTITYDNGRIVTVKVYAPEA